VKIREEMVKWYKKNARDFPWRHTKDPYKLMIAEFMLHRTKAYQVVPVYNKFIKKYPDVHTLSQADPEDIKSVTRHLGLHWRAKHFKKAAKYIVDKFKGEFPDDYNNIREIPGVGEYISGAILVVCFNKPAPVVDSNIARFINRYFGLNLSGELRRKRKVIDIAEQLFNCDQPGELLFALIDYTSMICRPGKPLCEECIIDRKLCCKFSMSSCTDLHEL